MPATRIHAPADRAGHHMLAPVAELRCVGTAELVRHVRNFVHECAIGAGASADTAQTTKLLASELVSNAVRHTPDGTVVRVELLHDVPCGQLVVGVEDGGAAIPAAPRRHRPSWDAESGRGIPLMTSLANECGVTPLPDGKRVWFALAMS
ncbi:ATP-binding protein [Embleya sp. NPDC056575]|uniref:ATP-binding protein n=1 Tax=unclassified Embleya TaxID=2699296 RepID=UPI0036B8B7D5